MMQRERQQRQQEIQLQQQRQQQQAQQGKSKKRLQQDSKKANFDNTKAAEKPKAKVKAVSVDHVSNGTVNTNESSVKKTSKKRNKKFEHYKRHKRLRQNLKKDKSLQSVAKNYPALSAYDELATKIA